MRASDAQCPSFLEKLLIGSELRPTARFDAQVGLSDGVRVAKTQIRTQRANVHAALVLTGVRATEG